jgi:hypothetical protein
MPLAQAGRRIRFPESDRHQDDVLRGRDIQVRKVRIQRRAHLHLHASEQAADAALWIVRRGVVDLFRWCVS